MIFGTQMVLYDYHHGILNRMFSQVTITDFHLYLDCLNFNCCLVGNSNETHAFVNFKDFTIQLPICKLQTLDKYCRQRNSAIINQRQHTVSLIITARGSVDH